ncbi:MAG: hypothetical protein KAV87_28080 [Desulfobacteraceae bacterium]|nr:hypothetical protein [Desulfobacteraceae bacterium]
MDSDGRRRPSQEQLAKVFLGAWAMMVIVMTAYFTSVEWAMFSDAVSWVASTFETMWVW